MMSFLARLKRHCLPPLLAFAAAYGLAGLDLTQRIENATLDWRTRLRAKWRPAKPSDQVLLVGIDEAGLHDEKGFGRWPWKRSLHGDLHQLLAQVEPTGPTVVGWDVLFPERSPDDADFAEGVKLSGLDVVLGAKEAKLAIGSAPRSEAAKAARLEALPHVTGDRSRIPSAEAMLLPVGDLAKVAAIGFVDTPPGSDGVRRVMPFMMRIGDEIYPSLSLQILLRHWHAKPQQVRVVLGKAVTIETPSRLWRIPIDASGGYLVNYRHAVENYNVVGYKELFDRLKERYVDNQPTRVHPISDRILLIGQVADGLSDMGPTPLSKLTPLVMVHVNVVENVLQQDYIRPIPALPVWLGGFVLAVVGLAIFSERSLREQVAYSTGVPLVYMTAATAGWMNQNLLVPIVGPMLGFGAVQAYMMGRRVFVEQRSKEQIKVAFGTYLSPTLVQRMAASGVMPQLGGHEEEITAYFSDIQGYSGFSEKLPPAQLVELLNDYLTVCTDIVQAEGGTLDKYIGDAVVAMFGAPVVIPDHAYRACVTALRVQEALVELRSRWNRTPGRWPEGVLKMQSRIGLNSGPATVGNMGSRSRFNYTMTGDNVNLAARMESGAKAWGVYTMCTAATRTACIKFGGDRVVFRPLGQIVVVGRSAAVPIFEPVGLKESVNQTTRECLGLFEEALARYHRREWQAAMDGFQRSAELEPNQPCTTPGVKSNPSQIYYSIARRFLTNPPVEPWNGVHIMTEK